MNALKLQFKIAFVTVLFSANAFSQNETHEEVTVKKDPIQIQFLLGVDLLSLSAPGASLVGLGPSFGARFSNGQKWFLMANVSQIMDLSSGLTSGLSSTLRATAYYSLSPTLQGYSTDVRWDRDSVVRVNNRGDRGWALGISGSENFLTGNRTVLAAPGFAGNLLYQNSFWDLTWVSEIRAGIYSVNSTASPGIGFSFSFLFF